MHACGGSGSWGREYCLSDLDNWSIISVIIWSLVSNVGCSTAAKVIGSSAMIQIAV